MLISKFSEIELDKITGLEKKYGIILPNEYKKFLLKYNGGFTPKTNFHINKESSDLRGFFGLGDAEMGFDSLRLEKWISINVLPIASDSFGNYIVIGLLEENEGKIFFCDHEQENRCILLSDCLEAFIRNCKSERVSEASRRSIAEREKILREKGLEKNITDELRKAWQAEIDKYANIIQEEVIL